MQEASYKMSKIRKCIWAEFKVVSKHHFLLAVSLIQLPLNRPIIKKLADRSSNLIFSVPAHTAVKKVKAFKHGAE